MKFKYNGQILETPNLEKKLKRMGLTLEDIEIIPEDKKIEEPVEEISEQKLYYFKHPNSDVIHVNTQPTVDNWIEHYLKDKKFYWDEETKTGLGRYWTLEYIKELKPYDEQMAKKTD